MADKLIAALFCLPNTTYDLPAFDLLIQSINQTQVNRMSYSANKTTPLLIYQPFPLAQAADTEKPLSSFSDSPLITKPPVPATMADKLIAALFCLPNTSYQWRVSG
jgi:hypothetical protein